MSQLNSNNNENKVTKKDKSVRNIICFLILFACCSIAVTVYLINIQIGNNIVDIGNSNPKDDSEIKNEEIEINDDGIRGVEDIFQTYQINDLDIVSYIYYNEDKYGQYEKIDAIENTVDLENIDTDNYRLYSSYIQIDGLKDKGVRNKINKKIKENVFNFFESKDDDNINRISVNAFVSGNFSNVLSITIYYDIQYQNEDEWDFTSSGLNFDLNTGEEIKFSDLFTYNTSIKNILTHSAYNSFVWAYSEELTTDMSKIDYSEIEEKVFKVINQYNTNPDIDFHFSPSTITAIIDNENINIEMLNYHDKIAIYNRFKSENDLYEKHSELPNVLNVFLTPDADDRYCRVEKISDNLYVNIRILRKSYDLKTFEDYDIPEEDFQKVLNEANEKIEQYKEMDDGKGRYYSLNIYNYDEDKESKFEYSEECYTADLDYCKSEFFPYIVNSIITFSAYEPGSSDIYYDGLDRSMKSKIDYESETNADEFHDDIEYEEYTEEIEEYVIDDNFDFEEIFDDEVIVEEIIEDEDTENISEQ